MCKEDERRRRDRIVADPGYLRNAVVAVAIFAIPFAQTYFQYRKCLAQPNPSRLRLISIRVLLALWVILAAIGVLLNLFGALGVIRMRP